MLWTLVNNVATSLQILTQLKKKKPYDVGASIISILKKKKLTKGYK